MMKPTGFSTIGLIVYLILLGGGIYAQTNLLISIILHLSLSLLLIVWLLRRPIPKTRLDLPLLGYSVWLLVGVFTSLNGRVSLEATWTLWVHVLGFYLLVDFVGRGRARPLMMGLFLTAALVVVISVAEIISWYFGLGLLGDQQGWFAIGGLTDPIPPKLYRLALALNVSTWVGNFALVMLPPTLAWALTARQKSDRQALWMVSAGLLWVLLFSQSRSALLGLIAAVGLAGFCWMVIQGRSKRQLALISVIVGVVAVVGVGAILWLSAGGSRSSGDAGRRVLWQSALDIAQDHPITGVGVAQYNFALRRYTTINATTDHLDSAHNIYLNTLAEIGIPGLLLMGALGGAFLLTWWRLWRIANYTLRIRLAAILAALGGFSVQSLADNFGHTSAILPLLILAAYVVGQQVEGAYTTKVLRYGLAGIVTVGLLWLLTVDAAQFRFFQMLLRVGDKDWAGAIVKIDQAQALDPTLRLYDWQEAYLLGRQAETQPDDYLAQAITAHESLLKADPQFYVGYANLAALYAQAGEDEKAVQAMQIAVDLRPDMDGYWLKLGEYYERNHQPEQALAAYDRALESPLILPETSRNRISGLAASGFWQADNPLHQQAIENAYARYGPTDGLLLAVTRDDAEKAAELAAQIGTPSHYPAFFALGYYAAYQGDFSLAEDTYTQARDLQPRAYRPYLELAKVYLALGQDDDAEKAARTALFLDSSQAAPAYAVLAQLRPDEDKDTLLEKAVISRFYVQAYDRAVFGHGALLTHLPQVALPNGTLAEYEPWLLLASRYAEDDDHETDPATVYNTILSLNPYLDDVRELCGSQCLNLPK